MHFYPVRKNRKFQSSPVLTLLAVPGVENCTSMLVPAFKEKSCPGKVGHPPNRVNFSEPLHEKIIDPFSRANARAHALFVQNSTRACSDCLGFTKAG